MKKKKKKKNYLGIKATCSLVAGWKLSKPAYLETAHHFVGTAALHVKRPFVNPCLPPRQTLMKATCLWPPLKQKRLFRLSSCEATQKAAIFPWQGVCERGRVGGRLPWSLSNKRCGSYVINQVIGMTRFARSLNINSTSTRYSLDRFQVVAFQTPCT